MIEIVWEFTVKEEDRGRFELTFGPGGAWSNLFARCTGFRGTTLLRDTENPRRYLTVDLWDTPAQREQALATLGPEYAALQAAFAGWTETITELGTFRILAEATVQGPGRAGRTGRGSHRTPRWRRAHDK